MFKIIFKCPVLINLFLTIIRGTPVSIEETIRLAKAQEILKYMKENVNPCEDFYEFACGNYALYNPSSHEIPSTGLIQMLQHQLEFKIKSIISTEGLGDSLIEKNVKSFYKSCMHLPIFKNSYAEKLREIIGEFGQMPALEGNRWCEDHFDWSRTVASIAFRYDIRILLDLDIAIDFANNAVNRLYVSEQDFGLSESLYREKDNLLINTAYLVLYLGIPLDLAMQTAKDNIRLEKALIKATLGQQSNLQLQELFTPLSTIDEVQENYWPDLDFKQLVSTQLGSIPNLKVYVDNAYLKNLIEVLKVTPKRSVANYIFFKLITAFIVDIPDSRSKLSDVCITHLKKNFYKNLDNMVYRKYNTKEAEEGIHQMWMNIKTTFQQALESEKLNWIGEYTRRYAVDKLNAMQFKILSYEESNFANELSYISLNDQDYIENLKIILSSKASDRWNINFAIPQPFKTGVELSTTPAYTTVENTVKLPVTLLQPNYASSTAFPNAFNFAVLGSLLSHELIHAYDAGGRLYDAQGNIRQWWDEHSSHDFNQRSKCFIQQYHRYIFGGQHLPEIANQNENIADNGGVRLSYRAYLNWFENAVANHQDLALESLGGYNHKQLFFISYAHLWCSDLHSDYWTTILNSDVHVPNKFRVLGPLSNFDEFSKEFNCPRGSAMNPINKCEIY